MAGLRRWPLAVAVLAVLAYVPALASSPRRMPADTKLYLYLDPGRLISDAPWTFDGRQFAGWVPHQVIAYLWPQGPWYWLGETAGLADWVTHRLWIGTLFLAAGSGVLWMARRLGLSLAAAFAAAVVYQLAPYILPYVSRTSAMLLPWAGLGWIVGLTALAATRTRWRHAALCALVVATVGAVNATALLMVAPAPVLWLLTAAAQRDISWRRAAATAARIGALSIGVSVWWITAVVVQGRRGANVLGFSESLESVSATSTAPEVWRGLGYWLTYVRDAYAPTTTAGADYMVSRRLIATGFVLLIVALTGLVVTRWAHRRFGVALVATGVVLGVGVHPIGDPSPLMDVLAGDGTSGAALALRSSTRAVPMLVLGLALGAGALADAVAPLRLGGRLSWRPVAVMAVGLLALANLPVLTGHRLVDPAIDRDQDPPDAWLEASDALDGGDSASRVLQLPGQEFGAFRWGYTVDPPLPGLTVRPLVTRDLLPLGSAPTMDLVYALDDRFQSGTVEARSIAPLARLLGADTLWLTGDAAFDRFRTPRPEIVHDLFAGDIPGLGPPVAYGDPDVNRPEVPMVDEQSLSDRRVGRPVPPVELVAVEDPVPVVRAKHDVVLVAGSGDGVVDAAAAGLLDGAELVRYAGSLGDDALAEAARSAAEIIVTDTNRDRAHHWRSSQDVVGFTEDDDPRSPDVLRVDAADERLVVFGEGDASSTAAVQVGPVRARASAYGEPFAYRPEDRPVMAVDGDPTTAWVVADRGTPEGELIRLDVADPIDHVTLHQPEGAEAVRHIAAVTIAVDDRPAQQVTLDERSLGTGGQRIDIQPTNGPSTVTITIDAVAVPDARPGPARSAVGFAAIDVGLGPTVEVVRPPRDAAAAIAAAGDTPVSFVFTRLRTRPTDRWRSDPEPTIARQFELPDERSFRPEITVRLDQRASDGVLADLLGITGPTASARLVGATAAAGWAAADGDPATAWTTPFGAPVGATLNLSTDRPLDTVELTQPAGDHSPITTVTFTRGGQSIEMAVGAPDGAGVSRIDLPSPLPPGDVTMEVTAVEPRLTIDRRYAEPVLLPAAIAEISVGGATTIPARLDTGCRDDLVTLDGDPIPVRVDAAVGDLLAGDAVTATPCGTTELSLAAGTHRLATIAGATTGLHVDRVVLADPERPEPTTGAVSAAVRSSGRTSRDVTVEGCPDGCWLVLGEGFNEAWSASITGDDRGAGDLGPPQLVDGGFNGWWIPPRAGPADVAIRWTAQTPLTIALVLTVLSVLGCLVAAVLDRRAVTPTVAAPARLAVGERPAPMRRRWAAAALWVVLAAVLVGPGWALVAAGCAAVLVFGLGRPRLAGFVTIGVVGAIGAAIVRIVQSERPLPDAAWPARFEAVHELGAFAAVSLAVTVLVSMGPMHAMSDERPWSAHRSSDRRSVTARWQRYSGRAGVHGATTARGYRAGVDHAPEPGVRTPDVATGSPPG